MLTEWADFLAENESKPVVFNPRLATSRLTDAAYLY